MEVSTRVENGTTGNGTEPVRRRPGRPTLSNEALLDKALDIFLEKGFDGASIDAITAAAGMAKRTVYARYGDKLTLFRAALHRAIEEWIVPLEALAAVETDDTEETLLAIGRVLVGNIMKPAGIRLMQITNAESGRMPEIGAYTYQLGTERTIHYLADLFRRRIGPADAPAQHWTDAAIAFLYLVVTGPPTMTAWGMHLEPEEIERHTEQGVRIFLHGLSPTPPAAAPVESEASGSEDLRDENRRLRSLLIASMLEVQSLKEKLGDA